MSEYTLRGPVDVAEVIPVSLGFHPSESAVMITFGGTVFQARVDLGPASKLVNALLPPALSNGTERVLFALYSPDPDVWSTGEEMTVAFEEAGIEVVTVVRIAGDRVYAGEYDDIGQVYDLASVARAEGVLDGKVVGSSRAELVARVAYSGTAVSPIMLAGLDDNQIRDRVLLSLVNRDEVDELLVREQADQWQQALAAVRDSDPLLPYVASVAAVAAWLCGQGAMAWICLDRIPEGREVALSEIVADLLQKGVPPNVWPGLRDLVPNPEQA